jgi:predicted ATPase
VLIGRDIDLERLRDAVDRHRLVTLAGPGGVGKTTLARRALDDRTERRGFVDLVSVSSEGILEGVAGSLGFVSYADMLRVVGGDEWLIVMDNCEHVLDPAASVVETLLDNCPGVRVIATSREPLDLDAELVLRLDPLGTEGSPSPAAQLFLDRARARGVGEELDLDVVEMLCKQLDGLPLAIELAAAKAAAMSPQEIVSRLSRSLSALDRSRPRGPVRHRGLTATIAWSYEQLDPRLDMAFARLAVFEGRFSTAMAGAAFAGLVDDPHEALAALTDRSLLVHRTRGGQSWFRMLDTIRVFGLERLIASGGRESTWQRVVDHVAERLAELGKQPIMGASELPAFLYFGFATIRDVAAHIVANDATPNRAFAIAGPLWWLEDIGHQTEAAEMIYQMVERWPDPIPASGLAYGAAATFLRLGRRIEEAQQSARIAISTGDPAGAAFGHRCLGQMSRNDGEWQVALDHFGQGVELARSVGQIALALEIEMHSAMTHARMGDVERAVDILRTLELESRAYAMCHNWIRLFLAWIVMPTDHEEGRAIAEDVISEHAHVSSQWAMATAHLDLGVAAAFDGDIASAAREMATALEQFVAINNTTDIVLVYVSAAALLNGVGDTRSGSIAVALWQRLVHLGSFGPFEMAIFDRLGGLPTTGETPTDPSWVELRDALVRLGDAGEVAVLGGEVAVPGVGGPVFRQVGEFWEVGVTGARSHVADTKGLRDIATLLAAPGKEIAALDLMGSGLEGGGAGEASDAAARTAYQERIKELQQDIAAATAANDPHRVEVAQDELDQLVEHLSAAYGLGGRERTSGDAAEKARSAVTWRIRSTIRKLIETDDALGAHLDASIKTGRFCVYQPAESVKWQL